MTDYYPTGEVKGIRQFINDKQSGKSTFYYQSGQIMEVQYYLDGNRMNGDSIYYEDEKLKYTSEFKDNLKNGYLRKWSETGDITYEARFINDTLVEVGGEIVNPLGDTIKTK